MSATMITPAPDVDPKDDLAAAAAAAAALENKTTPPAEERPAWLPEKFKTAEDLAKAYAELEKKQGSNNQVTPPDGTPPATSPDPNDQPNGLDWEGPVTELAEKGKISDETYAKFEQANVPRAVVDSYVAQINATAEAEQAQLYDRVGGKAVYEVMCAWAETNIPKAEMSALKSLITEGDLSQALLAMDGLKARYTAASGSDPKLINGNGSGPSPVGYQSRAEMTRDMRDPKYTTDPAFRKQVETKIANSKIF